MTGGPIALRPTANFSGRSSCAKERVAISGNAAKKAAEVVSQSRREICSMDFFSLMQRRSTGPVRPVDDAVLEPSDDGVQRDAHGTENDKRGKHAGDVGHGLR